METRFIQMTQKCTSFGWLITSQTPPSQMDRKRPPGNEIDLTNIVDGPRNKRSRVTYNEEDPDVEMQDSPGVAAEFPLPDSNVIKQGMRLWNAVKNFKDPM